jgi:hypothetical protein
MTAIEYPPLQKAASFNVEAVVVAEAIDRGLFMRIICPSDRGLKERLDRVVLPTVRAW